ncbi:TolC family protein [Aureimonas fodinaquatilis]|uniref:TolC family protein n=1 Tax=Aureimonas fodinaquatilis TaxID=2565783 RepID=A0A5B0DTF6_9HYPH|nr:TolC family protein [Aureimonas fodinaquatilis]KAA0968439.1 TolC family protein [Aureimonas fodinaquatilis]
MAHKCCTLLAAPSMIVLLAILTGCQANSLKLDSLKPDLLASLKSNEVMSKPVKFIGSLRKDKTPPPPERSPEEQAAFNELLQTTSFAGNAPAKTDAVRKPANGRYGIQELIDVAMLENPSLKVKERMTDVARTEVDSARWQFFATPSVTLEDAPFSDDPSMRGNDTVTVLRLQQPIWAGGRNVSNFRRAQAAVDVSAADSANERQGVALGIVQRYGEWLGSRLKRQAMYDVQEIYQSLEEQIVRRIEAGASAESDLVLLQSRTDQLLVSIAVLEQQEQTSLASLSQLTGVPISSALLSENAPAPAFNPADSLEMVSSARAGSPLLKKLEAEVRVADENVARARSVLSPEVFLRAERQYGNLYSQVDEPADRFFLGVQTQFGAGLSSIAGIQGAQYQRDATKLGIRSGELALVEQMSSDIVIASSIDSRIQTLISAVNSTELTKESWDRQFVAGRKTWLDVMNAAREHMDMKTQLAEAQATAVVVKWRLKILAQGIEPQTSTPKGERS